MSSIKVLTLNTWMREGPYEQRLPLLKSWIAQLEPDLIAFQEVEEDQLDELLGDFGYQHQWYSGLSIAAKWPVTNFQTSDLPSFDHLETAGPLLGCHIDSPHGVIPFINLTSFYYLPHDGWKREQQMPALSQFIKALRVKGSAPSIVVGDFNTEPESNEMRYLRGLHSIDQTSMYLSDAWERSGNQSNGATWARANDYARPYGLPDRRIDYIYVAAGGMEGPGKIISCDVVCNECVDGVWPSDHFGVFAEIQV